MSMQADNEETRHEIVLVEQIRSEIRVFGEKLDAVDTKVNELDRRVEGLEKRVEVVEMRIDIVDKRRGRRK